MLQTSNKKNIVFRVIFFLTCANFNPLFLKHLAMASDLDKYYCFKETVLSCPGVSYQNFNLISSFVFEVCSKTRSVSCMPLQCILAAWYFYDRSRKKKEQEKEARDGQNHQGQETQIDVQPVGGLQTSMSGSDSHGGNDQGLTLPGQVQGH